jgi:Flp pilus assembly protein TadD
VSLLAACQQTGGLGAPDDSLAPPGIDTDAEGVDPLLVGNRLMAAGEYDLALRSYTRAAGEQGATVDVLSGIGSANLRLGRLGQAEQILRRAIEVDETFPPAWNNLGVVLMETERYGDCFRARQRAERRNSGELALGSRKTRESGVFCR